MKVNISGTMTKETAADNGLDGDVGDKLNANQLQRIPVVALIEFHGYHRVKGKPEYVSVRFVAIEPLLEGEDDTAVRTLLDKARKARGLGPTELTLFDTNADEDDDETKGPWPGDPDFQAPGASQDAEPEPKKAASKRGAAKAGDSE